MATPSLPSWQCPTLNAGERQKWLPNPEGPKCGENRYITPAIGGPQFGDEIKEATAPVVGPNVGKMAAWPLPSERCTMRGGNQAGYITPAALESPKQEKSEQLRKNPKPCQKTRILAKRKTVFGKVLGGMLVQTWEGFWYTPVLQALTTFFLLTTLCVLPFLLTDG